eukprot:TRINITY_DN2491_c0_g2_i1.p1 TRINITY_DN2491_c0_g2~~TRINITY_DN2491_c0_g2_i1.p1  ORF type:complete len:568 (-),score=112.83 TRINITY_DN2491_c0_g2_i1:563-2266(-)
MKGLLIVKVLEARNLIAVDLGKTSDPYCVLVLGSLDYGKEDLVQRGVGKTIEKNLNPHYDETFNFVVNPENDTLFITVVDRNFLLSDEVLGKCCISIAGLSNYVPTSKWIPLVPKDQLNQLYPFALSHSPQLEHSPVKPQSYNLGEILIRVTFIDLTPSAPIGANPSSKTVLDDFGFKVFKNESPDVASGSSTPENRVDESTPNPLKSSGGSTLPSDGKVQNRPPEVLSLKGIPLIHRGEMWMEHSGAKKKRSSYPGSFYTDLLYDNQKNTSAYTEQIEKDLNRTFPGHPFFKTVQGIQALNRVLVAYSWHQKALGYTQGMNFIAGFLLLFMEEEDVFYTLCVMLENIIPGYFQQDMVGIQVDQRLFEELLSKYHPTLIKHLNECGVTVSVCCVSWFLCLYIDLLPSAVVQRLWDSLLCGNRDILLQTGLGLVTLYKDVLLSTDNTVDLYTILKSLPFRITNKGEELWKVVFQNYWGLVGMSLARAKHLEAVKRNIQKKELLKLQKFTHFSLEDLEKLRAKYEKSLLNGADTAEASGLEFKKLLDTVASPSDAAFTDAIFQSCLDVD